MDSSLSSLPPSHITWVSCAAPLILSISFVPQPPHRHPHPGVLSLVFIPRHATPAASPLKVNPRPRKFLLSAALFSPSPLRQFALPSDEKKKKVPHDSLIPARHVCSYLTCVIYFNFFLLRMSQRFPQSNGMGRVAHLY